MSVDRVTIRLVSAAELQREVVSGAVRVVDARTRDEYAVGHVPGAVWIGWEEWCAAPPQQRHAPTRQAGYWGLIAPHSSASYAARLRDLGLGNDDAIVVYADSVRSWGRDGRIAWMLLYLGARHVLLLDGGWRGWLREGGSVEHTVPLPAPGRFSVVAREERRARFDALRLAYQAGTLPALVDTRTLDEYAGRAHPYMPRMGHLPGAVLMAFEDLYDPGGAFVGRDAYLARLSAQVRAAPHLVTYCEVGVRASTTALLHEIYTGQVVAVYDGSLMEWALDPALPVHTALGDDRLRC